MKPLIQIGPPLPKYTVAEGDEKFWYPKAPTAIPAWAKNFLDKNGTGTVVWEPGRKQEPPR